MTTTTNALVVVSVDRDGVLVAVNGTNKRIDWYDLRAAARQEDTSLREAYAGVLREAEALAAKGPVEIEVKQDPQTNVYWIVCVRARLGGGPVSWRRAADEGGTLGTCREAKFEAEGICKRLGSRVESRIGF